MRAWLYRRLNHEAKAWPYYKGQRNKQRQHIKDDLRTIRSALACKDAYVLIGKGDNALYYQQQPEGMCTYGAGTLSGFGEYDAGTFWALGLPIIDVRNCDSIALWEVVVKGPMIAVGDQKVDDEPKHLGGLGLGYRPLREVARSYRDIGATIYNLAL